MKVFVYGTLRKGEANAFLLDGARYLGCCTLQSRFQLFDLGDYPAAITSTSEQVLIGEVYEVTAEMLQALDVLEEYPDLYDRVVTKTPFGDCWIYTYNGSLDNTPQIMSGDWCQTKSKMS